MGELGTLELAYFPYTWYCVFLAAADESPSSGGWECQVGPGLAYVIFCRYVLRREVSWYEMFGLYGLERPRTRCACNATAAVYRLLTNCIAYAVSHSISPIISGY